MAITSNNLRTSAFGQRPSADFVTNKLAFDYIYQDFTRLVTEINTIVGSDVTGSGTQNFIAKWDTLAGDNLGNSSLFDNGTSLGLGTATPSASSFLDITSTTKGFLAPRMTTVQRDAIAVPATGLLIYDTTTSLFSYYDGTTWQNVDSGTSDVTSVSGTLNRITSTGGITPIIDISASYVGQTSLTTLGTITTGTWNADTITVPYGGTGNTTFTAYSVIIAGTTATGAFQNVSGVGTSGQILTSNGAGLLPTWQTLSMTSDWALDGNTVVSEKWIGTIDNFAFPFRTNNIEVARFLTSGALQLGVSSALTASLVLKNSTNAFSITIDSGVTSANYSLTLPTAQGGSGTVLENNGSGVLSWVTPSSGITVGSTTITSGTSGAIPFNGAGVYQEDATQLFWDNTNNRLGIGTATPTWPLHVKGAGGSTSTAALLLDNSSNVQLLKVYDSGQISVGTIDRNLYIGVGNGLLNSPGSGASNVAIGYNSMFSNTSGVFNVAVGDVALYSNTTGFNNTAIGGNALFSNTDGVKNVAVGRSSLFTNGSGVQNSAVGVEALNGNTSGSFNTSIGWRALFANTTGTLNTAIGNGADVGSSGLTNATAIGAGAIVSSNNSVILGNSASVGIGLSSPTSALHIKGFGATVATSSLLIQNSASSELFKIFDGGQISAGTIDNNLWFGVGSGQSNSVGVGSFNTAMGWNAMLDNTTGIRNVAVGGFALQNNTTGQFNTAIGYDVMDNNNTGVENTAVGHNALWTNSSGTLNVGIGSNAGFTNGTASNNVAIGNSALYENATSDNNVAVGSLALKFVSGAGNTAVGFAAMTGFTTATGTENTAIGYFAGAERTSGTNNVYIGAHAGQFQTTASNQLFIDNQNRVNAAGDLTLALIYGVSHATLTASQFLRVNANVGILTNTFGTSADGVLAIFNGTAPSTSPADTFQMYSKDWNGAGTATLHARNEEGHIFIYKKSAAYTVSNSTPDRSYDATSTSINELAQVVAGIISDLQGNGLLG